MANIQISVLISEDLVKAAEALGTAEGRSRNFILNRWLEYGSGVEAQFLADKQLANKVGLGFVHEAQDKKIRDFIVGNPSGAPDPVFEGNRYFSPPSNDFPVVGFTGDATPVPTDIVTAGGTVRFESAPEGPGFVDFDIPQKPGREIVNGGVPVERIYKKLADSLTPVAEPGILKREVKTATGAGRDAPVDVPKVVKRISKKIAESASARMLPATPKIGEKCPHGWANWLQCKECHPEEK